MNIDDLFKAFDDIYDSKNHDLITENANTDGKSPVGQLSLVASESSKEYAKQFLDNDVLEAFEEGFVHVHDFDYYMSGTTTCLQIPLSKLLDNGFKIGTCAIRTPSTITTALSLASIIVQANQNMQHGGQSFANFDFDLAPYVRKSYVKHYKDIKEATELVKGKKNLNDLSKLAWERTEKEVYQACEGFVHNANSMLSRNGMQVPFISLNFGLDTSREGRMISKNIMLAQQAGLGDGSTPIFPILIFKLKKGINSEKGDINYDLYELALETTSKRLFPNFVNCDAPYNVNKDSDDPRDAIATMGCRTRVFTDIHGKDTPEGRGNLSFTTINLPMVAFKAKRKAIRRHGENVSQEVILELFYELYDKYIEICRKQLKQRLEYQKSRLAGNFKFLYGNGTWKGSDELKDNEKIGDILNTGTLAIGFIGLAEALKIMIGKHHGESNEAWNLGYEIVKYMRRKTDSFTIEDNLNFGVIATPAEGLAGKALKKFVNKYGVIDEVSDREYFTNSSHIPVYYSIKAIDKIKLEAPFHELENGGHIAYVELDGEGAKNIKALDTLVKAMVKYNIGYCSINHPIDNCEDCGYHAVIPKNCPKCGGHNIRRLRRITGYLTSSLERWNSGKQAEERDRLKHN